MRRTMALSALATLMALMALLNDGCSCNRQTAACDQVLIALCEFEALCREGESISSCTAEHEGFTCSVDVDEAAVCVDAINAALNDDCQGAVELPCPLLQQAGLYQSCTAEVICSDSRPCVRVADVALCTAPCDDETACPERGGCEVTSRHCFAVCDDVDFVCAADSLCTDDGCFTCAELCGSECDAVVEGCDCPVCPECSADVDCEGAVCVEGSCVVP